MTDFIVIGGGIAGLSAGARLAPLGKVVVLEAEAAVGYHSSGRSAALFEQNYGSPATVALNEASGAYHHTANGGYLSPRGLMIVARRDEQAAFEADKKALGVQEISVDEALGHVPVLRRDRLAFAGYGRGAHDIDTDRMMQDFARDIRASGGAVQCNARVSQMARDRHGKWNVHTTLGSFAAPVVVNAAGAWADEIAKMGGAAPLGIVPLRRSVARIPAPGGQDVRGWPMFFGPGESWYAKPDAGALLVSPAEEDPSHPHDAWADDMVLAEGIARYQDFVDPPVTRVLSSWAGLRSFAPDRNLVLGVDPHCRGFVWCAAQGGYGFQTAPAASALIADLIAGRQPALDAATVAALSPERFGRG